MTQRNGALLVVNYHYVRPRDRYPHPGIHPVEPQEFEAQVTQLMQRFHMATPQEVENFVYGRGSLPGPSVFLTFDDGLRDHAWVAAEVLDPLEIKGAFFVSSRPLLEQRALLVQKVHWLRATTAPEAFEQALFERLPERWRTLALDGKTAAEAAKIYIYDTPKVGRLKYLINFQLPADLVDEVSCEMLKARGILEARFCQETYMGRGDLRSLSQRGHVVGAHGHRHVPFSQLQGAALDEDLRTNITCLEEITGRRPTWVSYPYGRASALPHDPEGVCQRLGLTLGLTLQQGWNLPVSSTFRLKRINPNEIEKMTDSI